MAGFLIAMLSGALMSIQGVFNKLNKKGINNLLMTHINIKLY